MRKNLGNLVALFLTLFSISLSASTYEWRASSNKLNAVTDEAIHLSYVCEFSDRAELFVIDFNPVIESQEYSIKLLSETQKIINSKRINSYEYIAFIHKPGENIFEFDIAMKTTNQDSIENSVLGRDNGEYEEYAIRFIKQKKLIINVRESKTNIVGVLDMQIDADNLEKKAYEPFHFEVRVSGDANLQSMKAIEFKIDGVKIFTQEPKKDFKLTQNGYSGTWSQKFAFVSEKDFVIPAFHLSYFDISKGLKRELKSKALEVKVTEVYKKEELLDQESTDEAFDFSFIYYILTFIAGFLISKIDFKRGKKVSSKVEVFQTKLAKTSTLDELLILLVLENRDKYKQVILKIENQELKSLKEAKKECMN